MKKYYVLLFSVLLSTTVFSQIEVEDSSAYASVEAYRDDVFRMDLQQVPSGILLEYSLFNEDVRKMWVEFWLTLLTAQLLNKEFPKPKIR